MNWQAIGLYVWHHITAFGAGIGLTGGGVGFIKFLKHSPAPFQDEVWAGSVFDTLQDLVSNHERIGERRTRDGSRVDPVAQAPVVPAPVAASPQPVPAEAERGPSGIERP